MMLMVMIALLVIMKLCLGTVWLNDDNDDNGNADDDVPLMMMMTMMTMPWNS